MEVTVPIITVQFTHELLTSIYKLMTTANRKC